MTWIGDAAIERLRTLDDEPDFSGTRYDIVERIGRGGMGTVFRGRDRALDREVAIKVTTLATASDAERLRAEARTLARLEHPGIAAVHDVGQLPDGRVFTVMTLVRGERLDVRAAALPLADRLRLFDRICDAVAFAHAQGIVHRDLTPANIMVGVHGQVLVLDWGLAQPDPSANALEGSDPGQSGVRVGSEQGQSGVRAGSDPGQSGVRVGSDPGQSGVRVGSDPYPRGFRPGGTDGYVAPEAGTQKLDARADVYALGAILRGLLPSPGTRMLRPLESIVRRAMATNPADRYPGAADLAADVRQFTDGGAVSAHRETVGERTVRLARTYRTPIALVLAYLAMRGLLLFWQA
jgi:serine/threonine protein kinase